VELSLNGGPLGFGPHAEGTMFDTGPAVVYISLDKIRCSRRPRLPCETSPRPWQQGHIPKCVLCTVATASGRPVTSTRAAARRPNT
jgi:hypothetical protein